MKEAYTLAIEKGHTLEAKKSLEELANIYQKQNKLDKSIELYNNFLSNLDKLIKSDCSLVDSKLFELSEVRINQLEKEKNLQKELINKKNSITYFLIAILIIIAIFFIFMIKAYYFIKRKNKKLLCNL